MACYSTTNKLVKHYDNIDGLKTGWTQSAGYNLVSTMYKDNMRVVACVMGSPTSTTRNAETIQLLKYGVNNYELVNILKEKEVLKELYNFRLDPENYNVILNEEFSIVKLRKEDLKDIRYKLDLNEEKMNEYKDENVGILKIYYGGKHYRNINVSIDEEIEEKSNFTLLKDIISLIFN